MARWILKTEPSTYSFDRLVAEKTAVWDGVANPVALKHIRAMAKGDEVCIYHTGEEKSAVGLATVASAPYADPKDPRLAVVDLKAGARLPKPVTLAAIKADKAFAENALVKMGRLSVVPTTEAQWKRLMELAGSK
jgi:predicted RNA-binding protein with PUA-like domain